MYYMLYIVLLLSLFTRTWATDPVEESDVDEFIPTSEWQEVKAGQSIPAGLHVRMDLEKGGRWAKLMDDEGSDTKSIVVVDNQEGQEKTNSDQSIDKSNLKIDELKAALKKMKNEQKLEVNDDEKKIKDKFRSMDEIKSAFDELHLQQESDFSVMKRLLERYNNTNTSVEERILLMQDLEIYVHQVDNAVDFVKLNGISTMVDALNSTLGDIRVEAAHVIGSAVQSNPAVQVKAVQAGALPLLIRIVSNDKESEGARRKALYATSCLIRHFPAAQFLFKNAGGFSALGNCLNEHGTEKLRYKAVSLINDLAVERREQLSSIKNTPNGKERERQYQLFALSDEIEQLEFCNVVMNMLRTKEHDKREVLTTVMKNLHNVCHSIPAYTTEAKFALQRYAEEYKSLSLKEEQEGDFDSFFHSMYKLSVDLYRFISNYKLGVSHFEL